MKNRLLHLITLSLALTAVLSAATTVIRGPYLQTATPTSMVVRWRTDIAEASVVSYGLSRTELTQTAKAFGVGAEHIVQLSGLKPATRYFYSVGAVPFSETAAGKKASGEKKEKAEPAEDAPGRATIQSFMTPPEVGPAKATRVWFLGDAGTKNDVQRAVRDQYYKFTGTRGTDLTILLGDNAYPDGTDTDYQKGIFDMYADHLRNVPLWSCLGNHDGKTANSITQSGVYYDVFTFPTRAQAGGVPSGTEAYYSWDYANIHFISIDSHDSERTTEGAMAQWLQADLAATKRDWIVAFFHHPTYTKGTHNSDTEKALIEMRQVFLPILENGGVDLVVTGHSHVYERSPLIDGHYGKSETFDAASHVKQKGDGRKDGTGIYRKPRTRAPHAGEISIVTGSAGHAAPADKGPKWGLNHPVFFVALNEAGSSVLDVDGLKLEWTFINDKGEKRDWFAMVKE
jgi:acid phosphatase type 7